jgi:hypothetical protein
LSHNTSVSRATNFTPFKLLFGEEAITLEEIKFKSARTRSEAVHNPMEAESKDLLEPEIESCQKFACIPGQVEGLERQKR